MSRAGALALLALAACRPPLVVRDRGVDYVTEYHPEWGPVFNLRGGWRRVCDVCRGDDCRRVVVEPSTASCPER